MPHARSTDFREQLAEHLAIIRARTEGKGDVWDYMEQTREEAQYLIDVDILVSKNDHVADREDMQRAYEDGLIPSLEDTIDGLEKDIKRLSRENHELKSAIVEMKPHPSQVPEYGVRWNDDTITEYGNLAAARAAFEKWNWTDRDTFVYEIVIREVEVSEWRKYNDNGEPTSTSRIEGLLLAPMPLAT